MRRSNIHKEESLITDKDCFLVNKRQKTSFGTLIHTHDVFEINFIENGKGAQRIVGTSSEIIDDQELVLITNHKLEHGWLPHECKSNEIHEITIHFHSDLLHENLLARKQFISIKKLFDEAIYGISFSDQTIQKVKPLLDNLAQNNANFPIVNLLGLLFELSADENKKLLSTSPKEFNYTESAKNRLSTVYDYIHKNYHTDIRLSGISELVSMRQVSFCRFFKQSTGENFIDVLNEIRINHVTRLLANSNYSIAEICSMTGFKNLSNFNRVFLKKRGCTPREYRENYWKTRTFI